MASEILIAAMARTLWVNAWADNEELQGRSTGGGGDAPSPPPEAFSAAQLLAGKIEATNKVDLDAVYDGLVDQAYAVGVPATVDDLETFGHYLVMEALGHGVAWDDHNLPHGLQIPLFEFHITQVVSLYSEPASVDRLEDLPNTVADQMNYDVGASEYMFSLGMDAVGDAIEKGYYGWQTQEGIGAYYVSVAERLEDGSVRLSTFVSGRSSWSDEQIQDHFSDPYTTQHDVMVDSVVIDQIEVLREKFSTAVGAADDWTVMLWRAYGPDGHDKAAKNKLEKALRAAGL